MSRPWIAHDFGECHAPCPYCEADAAACRYCADPRPDSPHHRDDAPPFPKKGPVWEPPPHRYTPMSEGKTG